MTVFYVIKPLETLAGDYTAPDPARAGLPVQLESPATHRSAADE